MRRYRSYNLISWLVACLMALTLAFSLCVAAKAETTGTCGDDLTWSFAGGTLTVSGTGEMTDFSEQTMAPWYELRSEIRSLALPEGVTSVGDLAFYGCEALTVVSIPDTVTDIGSYAFADCTGLTMLDLGSGLQSIGESAFYGCNRLVSVTMPDTLAQVGDHAFRGCQQLTTVYYNGSTVDRQTLQRWIGTDVPGFQSTGHVTDAPPPASQASGVTREQEDGTVTQQNTTAFQGDDVTASVTVETVRREERASTSMQIQLTVENEQGWQEAKQIVTDALRDYNGNTALLGQKEENIRLDLFVKDGQLDPDFAQLIAQRDILLTVATRDGSRWRMDGNVMQETPESWDLRYTLTEGTQELCSELGVQKCYVLRFQNTAQVNTELLLSLGKDLAQQQATVLYAGKELTQIQTSVVDGQGNAHFYLASVVEDADYYVAINMPQTEQEAIVPEELRDSYGRPLRLEPIQYEITGVTSSFGVTARQFTWMLIAALVACVVIVGLVVWLIQKQKQNHRS